MYFESGWRPVNRIESEGPHRVELEPEPAHVLGIYIAAALGSPMLALKRAYAVTNEGLRGDRYAVKQGYFSPGKKDGRNYQITLISLEQILKANEILRSLNLPGVRS